ncbi:MAG: hypothetical protein ACE5GR_02340 [Nitrosopumilus sp.]
MTRTKYFALFAIIPMIAFVMMSSAVDDVAALKSEGKNAPGRVGSDSYGSANKYVVCGGVLCSEYPGGYAQYIKDTEQGNITYKPTSQKSTTATSAQTVSGGHLPVTHVVGKDAYIIDGTTPKGGHDAFSYDGSGHKELSAGMIEVDLDPDTNTGIITAHWTDLNGDQMMLKQSKFAGGNEMYVGETIDGVTQTTLDADPIAINHYEHGTTGAGPTIEPTLFVYLASWGPAEVFKNGVSQGTYEAHMMITEGARDMHSGKIVKSDGTTPYSPKTPGDSKVNHDTAQLHMVYHSMPGEMTANFPPPFEVFNHLMFYDISVLQ